MTFESGGARGLAHADAPDSWMRLKRMGNVFQGFRSANGFDWRLFAQTTQTFSNTTLLGLSFGGFQGVTNGLALFRDYDPHYQGGIGHALETSGLTWTLSGNQPWFAQTTVTHDGVDALQSGPITHGQLSSLETAVIGPGTLSFWWKVSSEAGADRLTFLRNGTDPLNASGEVDWEQRTVNIPAGSHSFTWTYAKNGGSTAGSDAAWLDQVVYAPDTGPPVILAQPADLTVNATSNAVFHVVAANPTGLPMSYNWFFNQSTPVGVSSPTLLVTNVGPADLGGYFVVVGNSIGSVTSRVATLELAYPPVIVVAPQSRTNVAGDNVTFTVTATNNATLPIGFVWRKVSTPVTNMVLFDRTSSFTLLNVASNATSTSGPGIYRVILTNVAATLLAPSSPNASFTLTVLPATAPTAATLAAAGSTPNGATLKANINPMGAFTTGWFDYGLTAAYGSRTSATNVGNAAASISFAQVVGGLLPGTSYHYRVVATNHGGMALGQDMTFQTAPLPRPTLSGYTRLPNGQFRLQFTAPAGSSYTVLVSTDLIVWNPLGSAQETTPGQFEFTDLDASGHPTRFYRLRAP